MLNTEVESDDDKTQIQDVLWKVFKVDKVMDSQDILKQNDSVWPVKKFIACGGIRARGRLETNEVFNNVILIIAEVISKSINIRGWYRYLVMEGAHIVLVEAEKEESLKIFYDYIIPNFKIDNPVEVKINAMRIRKLAKNGTEAPIRLTLLVNNQTAGVEGLETLTLSGDNIIRGIQTLKDRQEVDIKAESIGPWIEIETNSIKLEMSKGIKIKLFNQDALNLLSTKVLV
ncbi:MAG: hypothetical protein ACFFD1_04470 [Candidatus Thorarchaeota archaeon]